MRRCASYYSMPGSFDARRRSHGMVHAITEGVRMNTKIAGSADLSKGKVPDVRSLRARRATHCAHHHRPP